MRLHSEVEGERLGVFGEVFDLDEEEAGLALDAMLRRVSGVAALLECVLEASVVRVAAPVEASAAVFGSLEEELAGRGFEVRREVLWRPAPRADVWLGTGGDACFVEEVAKTFAGWEIS